MSHRFSISFLFLVLFSHPGGSLCQEAPARVPPRRSFQLTDGFGMNIDLPRGPGLPWTTRWWTRIFDSGVKWVRIGQYENSSERTSWDWIEQTPGHYTVTPDLDEAIRSLRENGVNIEIELQYSNPLYQGSAATRPQHVLLPPPGIGQNDQPPNPIFLPPTTEQQIGAFLQYASFMVNRYKGQVKYWELWNEPNIGYWQPQTRNKAQLVEKARVYGRVLSRFADAVHEADPLAKVMSAGLAGPDLVFAKAALAECASKVDIVAYHAYPGFGSNHMPEEADTLNRATLFRDEIMHIPGMRDGVEFWDNEWNVSPRWKNSNESVQARYVPRFYLYSLAQHVKGFMWVFVPSTDGNEDDLFGILHGKTAGTDSFQPREAYHSFEVTEALFGETAIDPMAEFSLDGVPAQYQHGEAQSYAFRDKASGRRIYAFWLAVVADPSDHFSAAEADLKVEDAELRHPILIDVRTGAITPLAWKSSGVLSVPLKDSVLAVTDSTYLDWPEVPVTPGDLRATRQGENITLQWSTYGAPSRVEIQRSIDYGPWKKVAEVEEGKTTFSEPANGLGRVTYRLRALGKNGSSAWSNPAW